MMFDRVAIARSHKAVFGLAVLVLMLSAMFQAVPVDAQEYVELPPELDARAAALYNGIMCPQCNGQTISQSHAEIAETMRGMVREQLKAGATDDEIYAFMVGAFGQSVLASPPTSGSCWRTSTRRGPLGSRSSSSRRGRRRRRRTSMWAMPTRSMRWPSARDRPSGAATCSRPTWACSGSLASTR